MPSKDTLPWRLTNGTHKELERIKTVLEKETGFNLTFKQVEIFLREKAKRFRMGLKESHKLIQEICLGKIK